MKSYTNIPKYRGFSFLHLPQYRAVYSGIIARKHTSTRLEMSIQTRRHVRENSHLGEKAESREAVGTRAGGQESTVSAKV